MIRRSEKMRLAWLLRRITPCYECFIISDFQVPDKKYYLRLYRDSYRKAQIEFTELWRRYYVKQGYDLWLEHTNPELVKSFYKKD